MRFYLGSPNSPLQANAARGGAVLMSYAAWLKNRTMSNWMPSYGRLLLDSGAFSELNSGAAIDPAAYQEWAESWPVIDAAAALDDIGGNTARTLANSERFGFPTFHDTDPMDALSDFVVLARERGAWLGLGLKPPRQGKEPWLRRVLEQLPDELHVHGWALGAYAHLERLDSVDSTHWWRETAKFKTTFWWLTDAELLEIMVKKLERWPRRQEGAETMPLFGRGEIEG